MSRLKNKNPASRPDFSFWHLTVSEFFVGPSIHASLALSGAIALALEGEGYMKKISKNFVHAHELGGKGQRRTSNF